MFFFVDGVGGVGVEFVRQECLFLETRVFLEGGKIGLSW